jgi:uncharacterized repeat protein (TIGR03803 family)
MKKTLLTGALAILLCGFATAQKFRVIVAFNGPPAFGIVPVGNPLLDHQGNLYGVTSYGGPHGCDQNGCGTIYEASPQNGGRYWAITVLYNFCSKTNCSDGAIPEGGMVADASGNLYGTTSAGGSACPLTSLGCGVVYELSPPSRVGGRWTYSVLYNFCSQMNGSTCTDGAAAIGTLAMDSIGNLYGTTTFGGTTQLSGGEGTVYTLSKGSNGWAETVLYQFCSEYNGSYCVDGAQPASGVTLGKGNVLYGTTPMGGSSDNAGLVYKLTPESGGMTQTNLYTFDTHAGYNAGAPVSLDSTGEVFTTFASGGAGGTGGILGLSLSGLPYFFYFADQANGATPRTGIVLHPSENIAYGLTSAGGIGSDAGTVYQITKTGKETVLYSFCQQADCGDGSYPSGLVVAPSGTIYGTTVHGSAANNGEVFEITP